MTTRRIRLLDDQTINQIAAGEVIENPSSAVKELIENALDAKATAIEVTTQAGGRALIRVSDNGEGMGEDEILLALERHATSKLSRVEELETLDTLGFRGEALPSIASVSKLQVHSCLKNGEGFSVTVEGGRMGRLSPLPRLQGTTVEVGSLFFNTPVRKKFQKSLNSEQAEISRVLTQFVLCHPEVAWTWFNNGKEEFNFPSHTPLEKKIERLLGEEFSQNLLHIEHQPLDFMKMRGVISQPKLHRPNRLGQYLFINGRAITSPWISQKILEGYSTRLSPHRYPLFVLSLTLPSQWIDVNVHPQKKQIRIREEGKVGPFIIMCVEDALARKERPISVSFPSLQLPPPLFLGEEKLTFELGEAKREAPTIQGHIWSRSPFTVIAQLNHFILIQQEEGIGLINIKYALERVLYEALRAHKDNQSIQTLLFPLQLTFVGPERELLNVHLGGTQLHRHLYSPLWRFYLYRRCHTLSFGNIGNTRSHPCLS